MATGADVQIDNGGFVRIHHAILEQLATAPLRGQQFRCLMFLLRRTYGYNRKEDKISLAQWAEGTRMERHNVWRELQTLLKCNVIVMTPNGPKRPHTWGFNKYFDQWNFSSVVTCDYRSVVADDYSDEQFVVADDYKSVVTPHERTKDSKDSSSSAAAAKSTSKPRAISEYVKAYEGIWGLTISSPYIGEQIGEWEGRVPYEGWRYALQECADTRNIGNWKYLKRILERLEREGYQEQGHIATVDRLDISIGEFL